MRNDHSCKKLINKQTLPAIIFGILLTLSTLVSAQESTTIIDDYLNLGTTESSYDDGDFFKHDRTQIGNQIKTFIPPLLAPAVVQHAYVLPPGSFRVDFSQRHISLNGDDFFKNGEKTPMFLVISK